MKDIKKLVASNKSLIEALADLAPLVDQMDLGFGPLQNPSVAQKVIRLADIVGFMPYRFHEDSDETDVAYLHFEICETHYYITNYLRGHGRPLAHGMIVKGERVPEIDFIDIRELVRAGAKLDLDWQPIPLNQVPIPELS